MNIPEDGSGDNLTRVDIELDDETLHHLEARALAAGRTLSEEITYLLKVHRGLVQPDLGDEEARERRGVFRRILGEQPPLMG